MTARIGVFDSGVGGITVLEALRKVCVGADFVYLGDTAHVPYGTKSPEQIRTLSVACAKQLVTRDIDALVVACNTASSWALEPIREAVGPSLPVIGVVEPGVRAALAALPRPEAPLLVLATRATVCSGAYPRAFEAEQPGVNQYLKEQACPLLVPMIEEGWTDHPILEATLKEYVGRYSGQPGVALLGCTHYPWIQSLFERAMPGWVVVNPALQVAREVAERLSLPKVENPETDVSALRPQGNIEWWFTDLDAVPQFAFDRLTPG